MHAGLRTPAASCPTCAHRGDRIFRHTPQSSRWLLEKVGSVVVYPRGSILFVEGTQPRGIFVLGSIRSKLTTTTDRAKTSILRVTEPGELLGLCAVISGRPYEVTAETVEAGQVQFISRNHFLEFLRQHGAVALSAAQEVTRRFYCEHKEDRLTGFHGRVQAKIARLLVAWANEAQSDSFRLRLTHEEIGQLIGNSRETITRALSRLKRRKLITIQSKGIVLQDRAALERLLT